ncbi:MAG: nucleoside triphosphate pyrophosphohydrolase [Candidatus Limiplasma sp.]|nr:nucleoside triphosphate pyrophosphohydrolase [Candidatus Limiplasma sp.]
MAVLSVVSLGTGSAEYLTRGGEAALRSAKQVVLRTGRSPIAAFLTEQGLSFETLDSLYEQCEDFDAFHQAAAVTLFSRLKEGDLCYVVGDAAFDGTVFALQKLKPREMELRIVPGVSLADCCLSLVKRQGGHVRILSACELEDSRLLPDEPLLLCELYSRECAGDCKLKLMELLPDELPVTLLTGREEDGSLQAKEIPLMELDRQPSYDHLSAVYIPEVPMEQRSRYDMDDLVHVMARLRSPEGCPWDREQTYESLLPYLLEESYEYIQAVREDDPDHMYDELGDVLLQVVFHAEIGRQHGDFDILDVTTAICRKMMERHSHIFGGASADTPEEVARNWEAIKRRQRGITTARQAMQEVSKGLSPTMRAGKVQQKAARAGYAFPETEDALQAVRNAAVKAEEALSKKRDPEKALGEMLFAAVNAVRQCGKNADIALNEATDRFIEDFQEEKSPEKAVKMPKNAPNT